MSCVFIHTHPPTHDTRGVNGLFETVCTCRERRKKTLVVTPRARFARAHSKLLATP